MGPLGCCRGLGAFERIGDHAVDVGEQTAYLITGELREFSDASHPQLDA